ncbi:hypothetical protein BJV74DRAFT_825296 [Russula compacta]|nr:hypothetical protein BJV74DRAFT_825296 [Russula compacta]
MLGAAPKALMACTIYLHARQRSALPQNFPNPSLKSNTYECGRVPRDTVRGLHCGARDTRHQAHPGGSASAHSLLPTPKVSGHCKVTISSLVTVSGEGQSVLRLTSTMRGSSILLSAVRKRTHHLRLKCKGPAICSPECAGYRTPCTWAPRGCFACAHALRYAWERETCPCVHALLYCRGRACPALPALPSAVAPPSSAWPCICICFVAKYIPLTFKHKVRNDSTSE